MMKKVILLAGISIIFLFGLWILILVVSFRAMNVPTGAMANTIIPGDQFFAQRWVGEINRGDILVFEWPKERKILYVMRVIGMPGETIQVRGKKVFINASELSERRSLINIPSDPNHGLLEELATEGTGNYTTLYSYESWNDKETHDQGRKFGWSEPFLIPSGSYFVLGDSRDNSMDSRYWGAVPGENFKARPVMIFSSKEVTRNFTRIQ